MASPQKENGYTPIANEILDALVKLELSGTQFALVLAIMRKTYGYHKKEDGISIQQFVEMLGISRRTVIYNLQDLEAKGIVLVRRSRDGDKNNVNIIRFNKDYETWVVHVSAPQVEANRSSAKLRKQGVVQNLGGSAKLATKVVQNFSKGSANCLHPQKITKDNTKDIASAEPTQFVWEDYLKSMDDNPQRKIQIISYFFKEKGVAYDSPGKAKTAIKRHLRAAQDLEPFSDDEINKATLQAKREYADKWTIETLIKLLTK